MLEKFGNFTTALEAVDKFKMQGIPDAKNPELSGSSMRSFEHKGNAAG